jgi:hypothetical protein
MRKETGNSSLLIKTFQLRVWGLLRLTGPFFIQQHVGGYARKTVVCPKRPVAVNSAISNYPVSMTLCFAQFYFLVVSAKQGTESYV